MYPADFSYVRVDNVEEAVKFLESHEDSRPLAGGQSLIPMLKLRVISPSYIETPATPEEILRAMMSKK